MDINDVVIHVDESLDSQAMFDLENQMRDFDGVIAPRFNQSRTHLMIVAYNLDGTSTLDILDVVRSQGFHAQHCGA